MPRLTPRMIVLLVVVLPLSTHVSSDPSDSQKPPLRGADDSEAGPQTTFIPHESPQHGPYVPGPGQVATSTRSQPATVVRGPYVSIQVNVDANGMNIVGDAANEPSIAVSPTAPANMVIGWRQFDTIESDFRQAGWGHSQDSGRSWTFPGVLDPGVFRSDPVLDADADGNIYFYSLKVPDTGGYVCHLYKSIDGGVSWLPPVFAYGGDKPWMAIDRTQGIGRGNIYASWGRRLTRSTDGGQRFVDLVEGRGAGRGTLSVGPDGEVYWVDAGMNVERSINARDPSQTPSFERVGSGVLGPGAFVGFGCPPNPGGLCGHAWIATDHSDAASRGNVYVLTSVSGLGVLFSRSTDHGVTWSDRINVNNDPVYVGGTWFGTMSVAPNGRIDAIWNDTRNTGAANLSELYYAFSTDAGITWSVNVPVSPVFDSYIGWPEGQAKIGDYYDMVSDNAGASVAYAATFNGEQDVYFLRIGPYDCNDNGIPDADDLTAGTSLDCNANDGPDECEFDCNGDDIPEDCQPVDRDLDGVLDVCDNCPSDSNADQADCGDNGRGDACELDADADGLFNDCDNCPEMANAGQADCDGDGVGDVCTIAECVPGNPACTDCNRNGSPDGCDLSGSWKVTASDGSAYKGFGYAVATDGDYAVVGALHHYGEEAAYVLRFEGGRWLEQARLTAADGGEDDHFGVAVSISGPIIVVGANSADDCPTGSCPNSGAAYVFRRSGDTWVEETKLTASDGAEGDRFGSAVSVSGDTAVIGAFGVDPTGAAYVFRYADGAWTQEVNLLSTTGGSFGWAVSVSEDLIAVSEGYDCPCTLCSTAAVNLYRLADDAWIPEGKLRPQASTCRDGFGYSFAIDAGAIVVGASQFLTSPRVAGAAYVFRLDGTTWIEEAVLTASDGIVRDCFGSSVSIRGDSIVVGASLPEDGEPSSGAAYLFRYNPGVLGWVEEKRLPQNDGAAMDRFGFGVSVGDRWAIVGAPTDRDLGTESGSTYVFSIGSPDCDGNGAPDECQRCDIDGNGVIDSVDFAQLATCLSGPRYVRSPGSSLGAPECCSIMDADDDGAVDLMDAALFQRVFTGP